MGFRELGVVTVGLIGLIGIILQKKIIDLTYKRFLDRRYKIASSFRKG
jgi:xanthosine utilization system XapX-like protein